MPLETSAPSAARDSPPSRLYLVCGAGVDRSSAERTGTGDHELPDLLRDAVAGGVEIVQLREKRLGDEQLVSVADAARALCERLGALLDRQRPSLGGARGGCRRGARRAGRHAGRRGARAGRPGHADRPVHPRAARRSTPRTPRWPTTSASARCTRPPPSPGARPSGLELIRYAARALPGAVLRDRRAGCSEPRRGDRRPAHGGRSCCGRSPRPRTRSARHGRCASCSTPPPGVLS